MLHHGNLAPLAPRVYLACAYARMGVFAGGRASEQLGFLVDPNDLLCSPLEKKNFRKEEFKRLRFADLIVIPFRIDTYIHIFGDSVQMSAAGGSCFGVLAPEKFWAFRVCLFDMSRLRAFAPDGEAAAGR